MTRGDQSLVHSVAFRVTEEQWATLQRHAENNEATISQLAKEVLFERVGLENPVGKRRRYGQTKRDRTTVKTA